ncbi:SDR family oxidoreductase [Brevibacterium luteolum]|uniref:SDR family NAD(P)-dependent oxidoreductase n=1 Tax=Brevibacterium luteolum TaxID=199591 RepID=UPI001C24D274|nr:SDR family oxidoreductase [Brevibacterium luteolum]
MTGSTGGIGRATCIRLAHDGYDIVGHYSSRRTDATRLQAEVESVGRRATMIQADLITSEGLDKLVRVVLSLLQNDSTTRLVGLVNNAARLLGPNFDEATLEQFDEYIALNTKAPFFLTQRLAAHIPAGGSIVNVSSVATRFSSSGDIVYAMSKAALEAMTFHAAEALAARGIRINTVMPGFTDNGHEAFENLKVRDFMSSFSVLGGVASPVNIADAIAFLISDAAARTTGSVLDVSGGSALGRRPAGGSLTDLVG